MSTMGLTNLEALGQNWARTVTSMAWGQWLMVDTGLQAAQAVLATATGRRPSGGIAAATDELVRRARLRMTQGLAPPREIYQMPYRTRIDWSQFPDWARPSDPDLFEGSGHEG